MAKGKGAKGGKRKSAGKRKSSSAGKDDKRKSKKGKGKKGRRSTRKSRKSSKSIEPKKSILAPKIELPVCNDKIQPLDNCRYDVDGCCKEAVLCRPNHYPGLLKQPVTLSVVGSENGTYDSICKLLRAGLMYAERVLLMTPWGNYVIFRAHSDENKIFFVFDGCTCNVNRFRYLDLNCGTAGLLYLQTLHDVLTYILKSREMKMTIKKLPTINIDELCRNKTQI